MVVKDPNWGIKKIKNMKNNKIIAFELKGVCPENVNKFDMKIFWEAETLNEEDISGETEFIFKVINKSDEKKIRVINHSSPYVCGDPISKNRNDVFFGRTSLIDKISRQVERSGNVILLEGNRRSGKSSILYNLEGEGIIPGWISVYCSLQGAQGCSEKTGVTDREIFFEIALSIAKSLRNIDSDIPLPDGSLLPEGKKLGISKACRRGISEENPFLDLREYIEVILEYLKKHNLRILLMLDEFDKLQEGIDNGITSPQVPENIRFLIQKFPGFSAILTGSRRMQRLREEYWSALYGLGTKIGVSSLSKKATFDLIEKPVEDRLVFSKNALEHTFYLTSGQPYLLQCLCNQIFDSAIQSNRISINYNAVKDAADKLIANNEHFSSLWDYTGTDLNKIMLCLFNKENSKLSFSEIEELLLKYGIEVREELLIDNLAFLRELELVNFDNSHDESHYKLTIPLMGLWIDSEIDFSVIEKSARRESGDLYESKTL